jgi:ABC-type phosphate transport system substrate-binding protein
MFVACPSSASDPMPMRPFLLAGLVCLTVGSPRVAHAQEYTVIVNEANPVTTMPASEIAQLFLKKKTKWPSGVAVAPVDQGSGRIRAAFSQEVLGRDVSAVRAYWQQQIFSGRSTAPEEKPTDAAVIAYVKENPGAIGYVSSTVATTGVKVLASR